MAKAIPKNMLFSLDGTDFAAAYGALGQTHHWIGGAWNSMAYWSDTEGGGRFTVKISEFFVAKLREWMLQGVFKSGEPYSYRYELFKKKFGSKEWMLYGNVYKYLSVIWRGKHSRTVGIKRGIKVPRIGIDGKTYGTISVAKYAAIHEFGGGDFKQRRLFAPAMKRFVAKHFPPMVQMVERVIAKTVNDSGTRASATSVGNVGDVISQASLTGMSSVASSNPDQDFKNHINEVLGSGNAGVGELTRKVNNKSKYKMSGGSHALLKKQDAEATAWLKANADLLEKLDGE